VQREWVPSRLTSSKYNELYTLKMSADYCWKLVLQCCHSVQVKCAIIQPSDVEFFWRCWVTETYFNQFFLHIFSGRSVCLFLWQETNLGPSFETTACRMNFFLWIISFICINCCCNCSQFSCSVHGSWGDDRFRQIRSSGRHLEPRMCSHWNVHRKGTTYTVAQKFAFVNESY